MTKQINITAIKAFAIITAVHQRNWEPCSSFSSIFEDFDEIRQQAQDNLTWANVSGLITFADIAEAVYGMDEQEFNEAVEEYNTEEQE